MVDGTGYDETLDAANNTLRELRSRLPSSIGRTDLSVESRISIKTPIERRIAHQTDC